MQSTLPGARRVGLEDIRLEQTATTDPAVSRLQSAVYVANAAHAWMRKVYCRGFGKYCAYVSPSAKHTAQFRPSLRASLRAYYMVPITMLVTRLLSL